MDPPSAIVSIVRIIGIEVQIVQLLQKEMDAIKTADERVEQILIGIWAIAIGLNKLQEFSLLGKKAFVDDHILQNEGHVVVAHIVQRSYNPVDYSPPLPSAAASTGHEHWKQRKRENGEEREGVKRLTYL